MTQPNKTHRVGLIVPSSNVTMETEIPALLRGRESILPDRFTFHSSRMRMKNVTKEELERMDDDSLRCAAELSDAAVDVQAYACLVAIMSRGKGYHLRSAERLHATTVENGHPAPVITSAGALVDALHTMNAKRVSIICPYMKPLARLVADYIEAEDIEVKDYLALEIPDNLEVARQDSAEPAELWKRLDTKNVDVIVASACVQMPSLASIPMIEAASGLPVVSASIATTWAIQNALGIQPSAPNGGALLNGALT
ncbi:MAG: Asp/Glu racemase [Pseudomonadota bacterium]